MPSTSERQERARPEAAHISSGDTSKIEERLDRLRERRSGLPGEDAEDEAPFREGDHPRAPDGQFGSSGSSGGGTKKLSASAAKEWLGAKAAQEIIGKFATKENLKSAAKEGLVIGIGALVSHVANVGGFHAMDPQTEEFISHTVKNFSTVAGVTTDRAKEVMRSAVSSLIASRRNGAQDGSEGDEITEVLEAVLKMLGGPIAEDDAGFKESDHPRKDDGKFGAGSGGAKAASGSASPAALSDKEKQVVSRYGEGNSYNVNKYLRDPKAAKAEAKKNFGARATEYIKGMENSSKTLDAVIAKSPLKEDTELYRGVSDFAHIRDAVANMKPGESFTLPTFSSTSKSKEWASDFMEGQSGDKGMIVINAKAGANALNMDDFARHKSDEQEMLVGRNEPFQFDKYDSATNTVYVTIGGKKASPAHAQDGIAFDRATVRRIDHDGHMFVERTPISKANVCPYMGREIPDWQELGLDPEKIYKLYRDPKELAKGAPTFAGKPLMLVHTPSSADDHPREVVVGSVGDAVEFDAPYLTAPLGVWDGEAISLIDSGAQKELSSAYHYRADMTPGITPDGDAFDGVMRDISGNHVCLVKEGRAGPDVVVGDFAIPRIEETFKMSKVLLTRCGSVARGALMVALKPKMAADAKIDLSPLLVGLTGKNFKAKKPAIIAGLKKMTEGKLAQDASLEDVIGLVDALEKTDVLEGADTDLDTGMPIEDPALDGEEGGGLRAYLTSLGLSEENIAKACAMKGAAAAMDETPEQKKEREDKEVAEKVAKDAENEKMNDMVTKPAMDAALKKVAADTEAATMKRLQDIRAAERAVAPLIGTVQLGLDSADAIYLAALKANEVDTTGVDPSAFPAMVALLSRTKSTTKRDAPTIAADASSLATFKQSIGDDRRIRVL